MGSSSLGKEGEPPGPFLDLCLVGLLLSDSVVHTTGY